MVYFHGDNMSGPLLERGAGSPTASRVFRPSHSEKIGDAQKSLDWHDAAAEMPATQKTESKGGKRAAKLRNTHRTVRVANSSMPLAVPAAPKKPEGTGGRFDALLTPAASVVELRPGSPFRPLDFPWQLGLYREAKKWFPKEWLDPDIESACQFARALRRSRSTDWLDLSRRNADSYDAVILRIDPACSMRWEVEARILANEPIESIGAKLAMRPAVIERYEQWFFPVRCQLQASDYIMHRVVRWHESGVPDLGTIWRFFGFHGGPAVLDAVIRGGIEHAQPDKSSDVAAFIADDIGMTLAVKAMISIHAMPVDKDSCAKILKYYLHGRPREPKKSMKPQPGCDYRENLRVFAEQFEPKVPNPLVGRLPPPFEKEENAKAGLPSASDGMT